MFVPSACRMRRCFSSWHSELRHSAIEKRAGMEDKPCSCLACTISEHRVLFIIIDCLVCVQVLQKVFAGQESEEGRRPGCTANSGEALPRPKPAKERPLAALRHLMETADVFSKAGPGVHWGWCQCAPCPAYFVQCV